MKRIILGTRQSPLARIQTNQIKSALAAHYPDLEIVVHGLMTSGDQYQKGRLSDLGGKGLFIKELEEALIDQRIDLAIHSAKDMETILDPLVTFKALGLREGALDAFIHPQGISFWDMPAGGCIGTASPRRAAILKYHRSDLEFVVLRGNVKTRLTKLEAGAVDAIVLAQAGLRRLDLERVITHTFPVDILVPSAGQGILVGEYLKERQDIDQILQPLSSMQAHALFLERAFLEEVEGHCGTPVGIYCVLAAEHVEAHMVVAAPDGTEILQETLYMPFAQAEQSIRAFGAGAKNWLKDRGI